MNFLKTLRITGSLLLTGALLFSSGCGYKNYPLPPAEVVPKAITDLQYVLTDKGVSLRWTYPGETKADTDITEVDSFELYRAEIPLEDYCATCPIPFEEPVNVPGGEVYLDGGEKRRVAEYSSGLLRSGMRYFFKVNSRRSWWAESEDSNIISFVYHVPVAAPENLTLIDGESSIAIVWDAVLKLIDGEIVKLPVQYQVEKSLDGESWKPLSDKIAETKFIDSDVKIGNTYHYRVKSSMVYDEVAIEGRLSAPQSLTVTDISPPAVVTGVTVVASSVNVRIFWNGVKDKDLAGYKIYRRIDGEKKAEMIGKVSNTSTIFIDKDLVENKKVYYSVTSFDKGGKESAKSKEATTRY